MTMDGKGKNNSILLDQNNNKKEEWNSRMFVCDYFFFILAIGLTFNTKFIVLVDKSIHKVNKKKRNRLVQ